MSCLVGVAMSFLAFGLWHFEGVKWGTILCALINGYVIGRFSAFYEKHWTFCDRFPWRKYFAPDAAAQTSAEWNALSLCGGAQGSLIFLVMLQQAIFATAYRRFLF